MPVSSLAEKPKKSITEKPQKYRLLRGNHYEPQLDANGNRVLDEQGTPQCVKYRQGEIVESNDDLVKKFNGKHPAFAKFRRVTEHEQEEWDELQAAMATPDSSKDAWGSMTEKELRQIAEENQIVIPPAIKTRKDLADLLRKALS